MGIENQQDIKDLDIVHLGNLADSAAEPGNMKLASVSVSGIDDHIG